MSERCASDSTSSRGSSRGGSRLDELAARVDAALAASAPLEEFVDLRRELAAEAKWLEGSREELEGEGSRVAALLEELAGVEALWSTTLGRPETDEAGEVVERRVQSTLDRVAQTEAAAPRST